MSSLVVRNIGQLLTLRGPARPRVGGEMSELGILTDAAMLISDGVIVSVGKDGQVEADGATEVDAEGGVVSPGFVDAHTHPVFGGTRVDEYELRAHGASYVEISQAGGGIMSTVRATRAASEDELFRQSRRYADWFLKGGTTTVEAKSGYGLTLEDELKILRVIHRLNAECPLDYIATFLGAHSIPTEFRDEPSEYVDMVIHQMIPKVWPTGLAKWCDVFCESIAFDLRTTERIMMAAKEAGFGLRMHVDQLSNEGGAALAARLGATTADHLEQTDASGIAALADAGVQPVLLPASVYALGLDHYPDARGMISAGLAVVLATDFNPGSSPTTSMPAVLSLACTHLKMSPAEAMTACTVNAAYSLHRGDQLGALTPGKQADFVIWGVEDYREIPYFFGVNHVQSVWKEGRSVVSGSPGLRV